MPIISAEAIDKTNYRITLTLGHGAVENVVVTDDGFYDIHYIRTCKMHNHSGRILNVVQNKNMPQNSYLLFDWSEDNSNRKERIYFYQVQYIKDITPNNAYQIAMKHGFIGSESDWLESMHGEPGKSAYQIALECGFNGTVEEWLESITGKDGKSAYQIALGNGFDGTVEEWLDSLKGKDGKSAYELAVEYGFKGTVEEWLDSLNGRDGQSAYDIAIEYGYEGTVEEWLNSLKGENGKSAYEIAVEHGFDGTEDEWYEQSNIPELLDKVNFLVDQLTWKEGM